MPFHKLCPKPPLDNGSCLSLNNLLRLITRDLGNIVTPVHKLNWSGIELTEIVSDFESLSVDTTVNQLSSPRILYDLDVDEKKYSNRK